jgi:hypothetical protein
LGMLHVEHFSSYEIGGVFHVEHSATLPDAESVRASLPLPYFLAL